MRGWPAEAASAASLVADRPQLWLAGGLSWAVTYGPVALLISVVPAPTASELTFIGSRLFGSAAWPWNALGLGAAGMALVMASLYLVSLAEVALLVGSRTTARLVLRAFAVTAINAVPVLVAAAVVVAVGAGVARNEFSSPDAAGVGPVLRTLRSLTPLLAILAAIGLVGGALSTAGRVIVTRQGAGPRRAILGAPALLVARGASVIAQALVTLLARLLYLGFAVLLLRVLWAPIGLQAAEEAGFDAAQGGLLVGFVAIWLCLVLGGGALHAWGSVSWAQTLAAPSRSVGSTDTQSQEQPPFP